MLVYFIWFNEKKVIFVDIQQIIASFGFVPPGNWANWSRLFMAHNKPTVMPEWCALKNSLVLLVLTENKISTLDKKLQRFHKDSLDICTLVTTDFKEYEV